MVAQEENKKVEQLKEINFNEKTKKDAIILSAYFYIKQLYKDGLLSKKELDNIKENYSINIE